MAPKLPPKKTKKVVESTKSSGECKRCAKPVMVDPDSKMAVANRFLLHIHSGFVLCDDQIYPANQVKPKKGKKLNVSSD